MSMDQNEPQPAQGQQGPPPIAITAPQEGGSAPSQSAQGNNTGQRRRRRRRKTGKPAGAAPAAGASDVNSAPTGGSQAPPVALGMGEAAAEPVRREAREPRPPSAPGEPREQQARHANANGHQGGHYKKQRQGKGGGSGSRENGSGQGSTQGSNAGRQFSKGIREYNPGNGTPPAGNNARRKNKVRRPAPGFVGPMDHSYRVVNGNIADGPPSTMDFRSNGNGNGNVHGRSGFNGYSDQTEPVVPVIVREDGPSRILCFIEDLFVVAKMQETARKLGVKVSFLKNDKETIARLTEASEAERPSLIVFDLNNASAKPLTLIPKLKAKLKRGTSVIGFLSHIQGDLKAKAVEAGCDMVMPKSAFSQNLPNLLRRHGLDEELETVEM